MDMIAAAPKKGTGRNEIMHKKYLRFFSVAMALILAVCALTPATFTAAKESDSEAQRIKAQMRRIQAQMMSHTGRDTFAGLCGTYTGLQAYFVGITDSIVLHNGNMGYDIYAKQDVTTGGYRVQAYPAAKGDLGEILNEITNYGAEDVYNLLVGWQATPTEAGRIYGHSMFIHAILDGNVYFMESNPRSVAGNYYPEGTTIICTIDEFSTYYAGCNYTFEGVIYFGIKEYANKCTIYSSNFYASALEAAELRTQPCEAAVDESSALVRSLTPGEQVTVEALYQNTLGEYWYKIQDGGYVRAESLRMRQALFADVQIKNVKAPDVLRKGSTFAVRGDITSVTNRLFTVRAQLHQLSEDGMTPIMGATQQVDSRSFRLSGSKLARELTFGRLEAGDYRYTVAAVVANHYIDGGELELQWDTVVLWTSDFQVTENKTSGVFVNFDACGGDASQQQKALVAEQEIGTLPTAQKAGYVFKGWYTQPEGGERVTEAMSVSEDTTLYAQWADIQVFQENWNNASERWYFYTDGLYTIGCMEMDGVLYYFSTVDALSGDWSIYTSV